MADIRIAVLGTRGFPNVQGGIEKHCEELYTRLAAMEYGECRGCKVRVYAREGYVNPGTKVYKGVEIYPLPIVRKKNLEAIVHTLVGVLHIGFNRKSFDIVHIHGIGPSLLTPVVRLMGLKVVVTNHGPDYERQKWGLTAKILLRLGEYTGVKFSSAVIAVSEHLKKTLEDRFHRPVSFIPNGVTILPSQPPGEVLNKYGLKKGMYILSVGRVVPEKGFHDLVDAYRETDSEWRLVIAGGADHEDNYIRTLRKQIEKDKRVIMTGLVTGKVLSELYSNAGLFISPSYHEGLPITILEAMSYDLPLLVSNIPAHQELIINKDWVFPPGDKHKIKEMLSQFMDRPEKYKEDRLKKQQILDRLNWDKVSKETLSVYQSILQSCQPLPSSPPDIH